MLKDKNLTILVAPLDWGLGHATRCIPIINQFLKLQCNVIIATEGKQENLLKTEFPQLRFVHLPGYQIQYSNIKRFFYLKIICQIPKIIRAIRLENNWLKEFTKQYNIDIVLSDNRYGFFYAPVTSVFLTHQLNIKTNNFFVEKILQNINYRYIRKFSTCWIPDQAGGQNLGGTLSHPAKLPHVQVRYIGILSRFQKNNSAEIKYKLLIILSGPEPQRTVLEKILLTQLEQFTHPVLFVRGLPGSNEQVRHHSPLIIFENHLPACQLQQAFDQSEYVISRSGYTTIMDICKLQKKSVLLPTPGQTEQEYLARHLQSQHFCIAADQQNFVLKDELEKAENFVYKFPTPDMYEYQKAVEELVEQVRSPVPGAGSQL